jgi:hypothetical protein
MQTLKNISVLSKKTFSKDTKEVKYTPNSRIILTDIERGQLRNLLKDLASADNVLLWNDIRRHAKRQYSKKLIGVIDGSGYINAVL